MHVDRIGAFQPGMCETDPAAFARAQVYVDTLHGALHEAGDLLQAIAEGPFSASDMKRDLADLCRNLFSERKDDEITLFKSVSLAIEDLVAAQLAARHAGLLDD